MRSEEKPEYRASTFVKKKYLDLACLHIINGLSVHKLNEHTAVKMDESLDFD